jgi:glutamate-1-semialdehyde 2,1-aminomutase
MTCDWEWNEQDAAVAAKLQASLPAELFDAHAHIYRVSDLGEDPTGLLASGPAEADASAWRGCVDRQVGERLNGGLLIPFPTATCDLDAANAYVIEQAAAQPNCRALVLVSPSQSKESILPLIEKPEVAGFKPYHVFASHTPSFDAPISDFLPEWAWELAHEHGLIITLHMVRRRALADPRNQEEIRTLCEKYPKAKLVLAHAARGFHAPNTVKHAHTLRGLDNIWFDTSGICESAAITALLHEFGPRRILWGSDFPISERRGKCVTIGDNFAWINPERVDTHAAAPE